MGRLPFDPSKIAGPRRDADPSLTVSQLCARLRGVIESGMPAPVAVVGEISGFSDRTHWYFALKDSQALVNCVMFSSAARRAGFVPASGQQVVVRGRAEFYAPQGRVTLMVDRIEPVGAGARDLALKALVEECRSLGWLDPARKRPLPLLPRRVAVITSTSGAALQDVLITMKRRCLAVPILTLDVRVQGERAAPDIIAALRHLSANAASLRVDVILLTRGGGSADDLWSFNDREVARAIVESSVPVVAAIGHETDTTLAELVADERCATPTQAAMRLAPDAKALERELTSTVGRVALLVARLHRHEHQRLLHGRRALDSGLRELLAAARSRAGDLRSRVERRSPRAVHAATLERLAAARASLLRALRERVRRSPHCTPVDTLLPALRCRLDAAHARAEAARRHLEAVGPLRVLERGYSVTLDAKGRAVRSPADVAPGEAIQSRVARGVIRSVVWETAAPPPPRKPKKSAARPSDASLFEGESRAATG